MNYKLLSNEYLDNLFTDIAFKTKLYQHQKVSLAFTLGKQLNRVFFFHDIGTGKSLTALALLQCYNPIGKTLIICPNSVISTWENEIKKHTNFTYTVLKGTKQDRLEKLKNNTTDIYIVNYEGLRLIGGKKIGKKHTADLKAIRSFGFECIIADESHHLKNSQAQQTKIAQLFTKYARYVILMTGTPIAQSAMNLFGQCLVLDNGATFGTSYYSFLNFYYYKLYNTAYNWIPKRVCNICGELYSYKKQHLKSHSMDLLQYRAKYPKKEVTSEELILEKVSNFAIQYERSECFDLPEKIYEVREISMTKEQREFTNTSLLTLQKTNLKNTELSTQKLIQITSGFLLDNGKVIHIFENNNKLKELALLLNEITGKFIIYHSYIYEATLIETVLKKAKIKYTLLNGQVKDKEKAISTFLENPKYKCMVANPKAGGEGWNGQVANTVVYYSRGYIGATARAQSEGRIHRAGQKRSCLYIDLVMKNSIDEVLYNSLLEKKNYISEVTKYLSRK